MFYPFTPIIYNAYATQLAKKKAPWEILHVKLGMVLAYPTRWAAKKGGGQDIDLDKGRSAEPNGPD